MSRTTRPVAEPSGLGLEMAQHPRPEPGAAPLRVDPHPLDLADARADLLHAAARDRPAVARGDHEHPRAGRHRLGVVGAARRGRSRSGTAGPARRSSGRPPRPPPGRPGRPSAGGRSPRGPAGRRSPAPRSGGRAVARSAGRRVLRARSSDRSSSSAPRRTSAGGERDQPAAPVVGIGSYVDQPVVAEPAQQPGEVAGVEVEPLAQVADGRARRADLEQQPGDAEREAGARGTTRRAPRSAGCRCG